MLPEKKRTVKTKVKEMKDNDSNKEKQKAVAILLSTYNGRNYIEKQLESIAGQTYENIKLFIRDDGSSDGTETLIEMFIMKNHLENKMVIMKDNDGNLGFGRSFYRLANSITGFDYYFFCDQDDYWLPDKVERAVQLLKRESDKKLICYMSNYYIGDDNLEIKGKAYCYNPVVEKETLGKQLFETTLIVGMAIAINEPFRKTAFMLTDSKQIPCSHDKWIALVLVGLNGKLVYDAIPTAIQRRHQSTTSSCNQMTIYKFIWRINHVLKGDYLYQIKQMITLYQKLYGNQIEHKTNKIFLKIFTQKSITGYFEKIIFPYRLREKLLDEMMLRILFLMGKYDRA